jgi:hypothetical protein
MIVATPPRNLDEHYCGRRECEEAKKPCDLCLAQRRHQRDQQSIATGKPTLYHNPFAHLLLK